MSIRSRMTLAVVVLAAMAVGTVDVTTFLLLRRDEMLVAHLRQHEMAALERAVVVRPGRERGWRRRR